MSRLSTVPLKGLIKSASSGFASGEKDPDGIAQIRMNNVETDGSWNWSSIRRVPRNKVKDSYYLTAGDVIFNATNSPNLVGKSAYFKGFDEPIVFSNHFVRLQPNTSKLDGRYLSRWLNVLWRSRVFESGCTQWVNQATYRKDDLLSLEIPLPPLAEQKRIAAILDAADALRAKRRESLAQLDTLLQSTFLDMFGDPVTNPKGWVIRPLGDIGALDRGVSKHRPRNAPFLLGGPHPLIQTGDVANSGGYIRKFASTYSDEGLKQSKMWPAGTLCITIAANIASTGILTFDACFPDSVVGFRSDVDGRSEYVQGLFWFFREILERKAPQVAQKNINLKILREMPVPYPPSNLQHRFATIVVSVEQQKARLRAHLAELDTLFSSLQSRAFGGEL